LFFDQSEFRIRFDWGERGLEALGPGSDAIVIVDVLSFTTAVDVALARGATVFPHRQRDASAAEYALEKRAILAGRRGGSGYSLSPASLVSLPTGSSIVLPSPNGATLSLQAVRYGATFAACLRNAPAVAEFLRRRGGSVAVIACGERWDDGSLRPAWEDMVGTGAVIEDFQSRFPGELSPEAELALAAFRHARKNLKSLMKRCVSGKELLERGFGADVEIASDYGASRAVPQMLGDCYVNVAK